jgi:hypothetical protein
MSADPPCVAPGVNGPGIDSETRVYAAALEGAPCPACAAFAGLEYGAGDPTAPEIPNPACTHPRGCRCAWL